MLLFFYFKKNRDNKFFNIFKDFLRIIINDNNNFIFTLK